MIEINPKYYKKGRFQKRLKNNNAQCLTCERKCVIIPNNLGCCKTRINKEGKIFSIVYGCIPAISFNPIEKKPLFHFHPGTIALTIGTYGCNFDCFWCQNHHLSHPRDPIPLLIKRSSHYLSVEDLIKLALRNNCQGTSISFNEPTLLLEYSLELFRLAKKHGLYNTYVSNGYMTEDVLKELARAGLDAINIDVKGNAEVVRKYCGADVEKVWRNARIAKELGIHVEITTLVIENLNSDSPTIESIASRIYSELGEYTPFHITRFYPHYKSWDHGFNKPTSIELLKKLYTLAKNTGLKHVYLGNVPDLSYENTICPRCSKIVIKRKIFGIDEMHVNLKGECKYCGFKICIY